MPIRIRPPAVAGKFYSSNPAALTSDIQSYLSPAKATVNALGCMVPHAGYMYSGHVAGAVFAKLNVPSRVILMCPNHTGRGAPLSISSDNAWQTPLGTVTVDAELASALQQRLPLLRDDIEAHRSEHAAEVELPFLQVRRHEFSFVPIAIGTGQFEPLEALGLAIADVISAESVPVLVIASSDMNHYESDAITRIKDSKALDRVLAMDARGLWEVIRNEGISMCGFGPAVAMITATRRLGASSAELVKYSTSGDVSGDRDMVVGYAGVIVR